MNRFAPKLSSVAEWLSYERMLMFGQLVYGLFVLSFDSFQGSKPWASLAALTTRAGLSPEWLFACLLLNGAAMQCYGRQRESIVLRMWGAGFGFTAFFIAVVSQIIAAPTGTGVPAYGFIDSLYALLVFRLVSNVEWVSIRR